MDMDKENILSKKDLEFLQEWILQDRNMRKGKIESDFDKFCEEKCVALENLISAFLKTQSGLVESKKIIVNLTNLCDEWADKYLALKSELAEISDNYARLDEKYDYLQSMHEAVVEESLRYEKEIEELKQKLAKKEKLLRKYAATSCPIHQDKISFAIDELSKVNGILTDTIIEVTQDEFDLNKLYCLEEISAKFGEKIDNQIKKIKGEE